MHHSWTDWDWSDQNFNLSTLQKWSPPTSLRFEGAGLTFCLCNLADALCLPEGKLVTWHTFETGIYGIITFRNQKAAPDADYANCYYVRLEENYIRLYRRVASADTILGDWVQINERNTWRQWTITWWHFHEPHEDEVLRIRVHGDVAGVAGIFEEEVDDPANQWRESATNRTGLAGLSTAFHEYFDDTEIWLPS